MHYKNKQYRVKSTSFPPASFPHSYFHFPESVSVYLFYEWRLHSKLLVCSLYIVCTYLYLFIAVCVHCLRLTKIFCHLCLCVQPYHEVSYNVTRGILYEVILFLYWQNQNITDDYGIKRKNRLSFVIKKSSKFAILIASKSISSRFTNYCFTSAGFNLIHSMYISN